MSQITASVAMLEELKSNILNRLQVEPKNGAPLIDKQQAVDLLTATDISAEQLLQIAELPRRHFHQNKVLIHILNNIRNGNCAENCGYCAQRNSANGVPTYTTKPEEEIMAEATAAKESGAYRYCLVTAGRGTSPRMAHNYAKIIRRINDELGLKVCLSAGLINNAETAKILAEAGLNRYNHNLNTSESHYDEIATTHSYQDRLTTLEHLSSNGVSLCSGAIAGMGESRADLVSVAFELNRLGAASIPINFFLPVEGHAIKNPEQLSTDDCLKILSVFRLVNPAAEVRMAAGRELYLAERQGDGLRVANSLFVSGYLNVKGSSAEQTIRLIYENQFCLDDQCENEIKELKNTIIDQKKSLPTALADHIEMKKIEELRPFQK